MRTSIHSICIGLLALVLLQPALAQQAGGGQRMQGGGINYAPQPALYTVLFVDADGHQLQLRAADGRTGFVEVPEGTYDLSKLKAGDKIRVDFVAPDKNRGPLRAATIWPAN